MSHHRWFENQSRPNIQHGLMWKLAASNAHTLRMQFIVQQDILCLRVKLVKGKIFAFSHILDFLKREREFMKFLYGIFKYVALVCE